MDNDPLMGENIAPEFMKFFIARITQHIVFSAIFSIQTCEFSAPSGLMKTRYSYMAFMIMENVESILC